MERNPADEIARDAALIAYGMLLQLLLAELMTRRGDRAVELERIMTGHAEGMAFYGMDPAVSDAVGQQVTETLSALFDRARRQAAIG